MSGECFLCKEWSNALEEHHIFGGALRKKSEKYKLKVNLCHECHNEPPKGVHFNRETMQELHEYGQRKAMEENNWTIEDFRKEFYANYL